MDLTAVATPGYFASMGLEHWLLKRRAERIGPTAADYERGDTLANLAMGTASLLIPMVTYPLAERIAPQRSKVGKGLDRPGRRRRGGHDGGRPGRPQAAPADPRRHRVAWEVTTGGPMASTNGDGPSTNGHDALRGG